MRLMSASLSSSAHQLGQVFDQGASDRNEQQASEDADNQGSADLVASGCGGVFARLVHFDGSGVLGVHLGTAVCLVQPFGDAVVGGAVVDGHGGMGQRVSQGLAGFDCFAWVVHAVSQHEDVALRRVALCADAKGFNVRAISVELESLENQPGHVSLINALLAELRIS